jgi:hypothetical protein
MDLYTKNHLDIYVSGPKIFYIVERKKYIIFLS